MRQPTSGAIVQVRNVTKQVAGPAGTLTILEDISLEIPAGSAAAVLGASGSGKSTLLGLMAGLDTPTRGSIVLDGTDLSALDEDGRARVRSGRVGFVFQAFHLLPTLTALENVLLPLELAGDNHARDRALDVLRQVGIDNRCDHYPNQLSGGEQQRVAIARAFAAGPRILFADEPTGNLDQHTGERIIELLFALNRAHGTTLVLVSHDRDLASRCDLRFGLDGGRLQGDM